MPALLTLSCTAPARRAEIVDALVRGGLELTDFFDDLAAIHILDDSEGLLIRNNEETLIQLSVSLPPDDIVGLVRTALHVTTLRAAVRSFENTESAGVIAVSVAQEARDALVPVLFSADALAAKYAAASELTHLIVAGLNRVMSILLRIAPSPRPRAAPPTCANIVITELSGLMRALARHAKVITRLETPLPPAAIERTDLERILLNLVANATDAQRILVATSSRTEAAPAGDWIVVEVENDGTTMSDEVCEQVLRPTVTPIRITHAPGRGLQNIARVTHTAGGRMAIDNSGRGTRIEIWLPRAAAD
jgi:two-component system cell cycle sensor histidine kinase/response regulator CckA